MEHACTLGRYCIEGQCRPDGYGLVGHWKFDEDGGDQAIDSSGNNLAGLLSPGVRRVIDPQRGKVLSFDGSTATVTVRNRDGLFDVRNQLTMAAWLKPEARSKYACLVCRGWENDSNDHYNLGISDTALQMLVKPIYNTMAGAANSTQSSSDWVHAVGTYDGTAVRLFINGEQVATAALSGEIKYGTTDGGEGPALAMGHGINASGPSEYFNGLLDDVRFDDRAYSADEIRVMYLGSKGR